MSTENLILEHLRAIRTDVSGVKSDVKEIKSRLSSIETTVGGIKRDLADLYIRDAENHVRHDSIIERIERIEKRLDLVSPEH